MDIIELAIKDLGYTEYPSGSNHTKFGKQYGVNGVPWCMQAVWCWHINSGHPLPYKTASCSALLTWYRKNKPEAIIDIPHRGDIVIYNFGHCGIVEFVEDDFIIAIEGNTSVNGSQSNGGEVCRRKRKISKTVTAFIRGIECDGGDYMTGAEINKELTDYTDNLPESGWSQKEGSFEKAKRLGITDGSAPRTALTREQLFAVLDRLGLLDE